MKTPTRRSQGRAAQIIQGRMRAVGHANLACRAVQNGEIGTESGAESSSARLITVPYRQGAGNYRFGQHAPPIPAWDFNRYSSVEAR